jgi:regulator of sirC expression with transglutaminase-like and TPR domain
MQLTLQDAELKALIRLLDDPDDNVYSNISEKLVSYGKKAVPFLEIEWEVQHQNAIQKRIEQIIDEIEFDQCAINLNQWALKGSEDLLLGTFLSGSFQYPYIDLDPFEQHINLLRKDVWLELNDNLTSLEKVRVINHILFDVHQISSNSKFRNNHRSFFLNNLLPDGSGSPTLLAILYKVIADKLELPIEGIDLPHHFILGYRDVYNDTGNEMLFYINPFSKGAVFGRGELERFMEKMQIEKRVEDLRTLNNIQIIIRLLTELKDCYQRVGKYRKMDQANSLIQVLSSSNK